MTQLPNEILRKKGGKLSSQLQDIGHVTDLTVGSRLPLDHKMADQTLSTVGLCKSPRIVVFLIYLAVFYGEYASKHYLKVIASRNLV